MEGNYCIGFPEQLLLAAQFKGRFTRWQQYTHQGIIIKASVWELFNYYIISQVASSIRLFSLLFFVVAFFLPRIFFSSFNAFFFLNSFLSLFSRVLFLIFLSFSQFFFTLFNFSLSPLSFCSLHHFFVFSLYRFFVPLSLPNIFFPLSFFPYPTVVITPSTGNFKFCLL